MLNPIQPHPLLLLYLPSSSHQVHDFETTTASAEGSFLAQDNVVFDGYQNNSITVLVELMLGIDAAGRPSKRLLFFTMYDRAHDEATPHTGVFAKEDDIRWVELRGAWPAILTRSEDGPSPPLIEHTQAVTHVKQGIFNVIGYNKAGDVAQGRASLAGAFSYRTLTAQLDPTDIRTHLKPDYYSVLGSGQNSYCTSWSGPCASYLWCVKKYY